MMNILIKNGTIITSDKTELLDIFIENHKIKTLDKNILPTENCEIIDAQGKFVIPGGIDPHVHMHLSTAAGFSSDNFKSGSIAALFGGTTTLIDFVTPRKGQTLPDALEARKKEAELALTDYSFHVSPIDFHENTQKEIEECIAQGITSFKVYLAYLKSIGLRNPEFFKVLQAVGKAGGTILVHCEMGEEIELLQDQFFAENKTEPKYHPLSRPSLCEADAVKNAIDMAHEANCTLYVVHVSAKESVEHIAQAQQIGYKVIGETCPHYLVLDDSKYEGTFEQTAPYVLSPPLRKKEDNTALWKALQKGIITTVGTDHCPFTFEQKSLGKADFRKIPNGAGGVEHRLALLYTYGVLTGKLTLNEWVDLCSTQAAKVFGLYPKKGSIAIGSDADMVIWNPEIEQEISVKTHHQNCDANLFEGMKTKGTAEYVIKNGVILIEKGKMNEAVSSGKFLFRNNIFK